jgi:hypothetical protein
LTEDEVALVGSGLGPPTTYLKAPSGQINVAGTTFKASSTKDYQTMAGAVFMAVRDMDSPITYFGIIREVLQVLQVGSTTVLDDLVLVDWFKTAATERSPLAAQHPILNVPVVKKGFYSASAIGVGNLWSVRNIVPINLSLMPNVDKQSRTASSELVVLSRDARLHCEFWGGL